jgi:DNA-binding response OmpR family regulator
MLRDGNSVPQPLDPPSVPSRPITGESGIHVDDLRAVSPRRTRILLVSADHFALRRLESSLTGQGYEVIPASTFELATKLLKALTPDLLVADVRLGPFNGLHLVVRTQFLCPTVRAIILHTTADSVLESQAERLGAAFVVNPLQGTGFMQRVRAALELAPVTSIGLTTI